EVFAIKQAVEDLRKLEKPWEKVLIRSDSQSVIAALFNPLTSALKSGSVKKSYAEERMRKTYTLNGAEDTLTSQEMNLQTTLQKVVHKATTENLL
ncbi:Putative LOC101744750, partial [Caligus rogercresseyi]